jgi:Cu2+-exporting ATPase
MRGRLRVRYPVAWMRTRRADVESGIAAVPGVRAVRGNATTGSLRIDYDPFALAEDAILAHLRELTDRLDAPPSDDGPASPPRRRRPGAAGATATLIGTASVLAAVALPAPPAWAAGLVLASGMPTLVRAGESLVRRRHLNGDVLEASTLLLLTLRGHYVAGALLSTLRALGEFVVARTTVRTRRSLHDVVAPTNEEVTRVVDGVPQATQVGALVVGDVVTLTAATRVPVDGTVVRGEALVDQQTMTGESLPVERREGDRVFAATALVQGAIDVRVERVGLTTAVGRIVRAIEIAIDEKSDIERFAERLAEREVARTLALAGIGTLISRSVSAGIAVLVADYGTAARVGIPAAIVASIRRASGAGILVKGPRALENLARVDTVVFDKTGTLTLGTPHVSRVVSYDRAHDADALVALAAAAEHGFHHPVARAVARYATTRGLTVARPSERALTVGLGVDVTVEGMRVCVGSRRFMESLGVDLSDAAEVEADAHTAGAAPTFIALNYRLAGALVLEDRLRPDASVAVRALRARRMRNVMLFSGDHGEPTRLIAGSLGLRHYHAELLPEDKARLIFELREEGRVVAMVGDGVNDALALAAADVGIAVSGGAEVTTEAADVVVLRGGLEQVVGALDLAGQSIGAVRQTLRVAAQANLAVVALASFGLTQPLVSIILSHGTTVATAMATVHRLERAASPSPSLLPARSTA